MTIIRCLAEVAGLIALRYPVSALVRWRLDAWLRKNNLLVVYMDAGGFGDAVCLTGFMRSVAAANPGLRFVVMCRYPEFFRDNPLVYKFIGSSAWRKSTMHKLIKLLRLLKLAEAFGWNEGRKLPAGRAFDQLHRRPHLIELQAEKFSRPADFRGLRNDVPVAESEIAATREKFNLHNPYALVAPAGKNNFSGNKEWGVENFRATLALLPRVRAAQVGATGTPLLPGAVDLRGRTTTRELCALIAGSEFVFAIEGLHNHLAGACGVPSFVIVSGYHYPELTQYPATVPIAPPARWPCSPCWSDSPCPVGDRPCLASILPERVAGIIGAHPACRAFD